MLISIIIPTYRRPNDLALLLNDLAVQQASQIDDGVEILVIDNCPHRSAESVIATFAAEPPPIYVSEPRPGVAQARNRGVALAKGRYVLFIDDDERPGSDWLSAWCSVARQGPDAVFGGVRPLFETAPAPTLRPALEALFSREMHVPDGADITAHRAWLGTGNSLFDRERCFAGGMGFDSRLTAGGEDVVLLRQLVEDRGLRLTWSARTPVIERVPASRMTVSYVRRRKFRNGQLRCLVEVGGGHWQRVIFWMGAGLVQAGLHGAVALLLMPLNRAAGRARWAVAAGGLGKVFWWLD